MRIELALLDALEAIKNTCREYIQSTLAQQFGEVVRATLAHSNIDANVHNRSDAGRDNYGRPAVKIESGAKSALDPHDISQPQATGRTFDQADPELLSRSAIRRLTVDVGILRRRAASEKLLASITWAKIISELRSGIVIPLLEI